MIVVTGATGTIGRALVGQLPPDEVIAVVRAPAGFACREELGDFDRPETIGDLLSPGDRLFLNSSIWPGFVAAHQAVIDLAGKAGVAQVVTVSVRGARPGGLLGIGAHGEIDRHLRASGIPHAILQPTGYLQNLPAEVRDGRFHGSYGPARVNYLDARDIADVAAVLLTGEPVPGADYALTGSESLTHEEIAAVLSEVTGRDIRYVDLPEAELRARLESEGVPESVARDLPRLMASLNWSQTTSVIRDTTGRDPRTLAEFAAEFHDRF
ncbi:NAD(P)H-binding protein [Nonomuraea longicatena]|uniref:SDR family oxidoreductase n=1 Tax=Nonomuraea longicatena TaxID=83682 RepID=A0ABN1R6N6_9ACTN